MNVPTPSRRNPWPIAIIVFFTGFFLFTTGLVIFASRQKMDLVRGDYYDEEIRYQEQLNRMNLTQPFADRIGVHYDASRRSITVKLPAEQAHRNPTGRIRLYRPSDETLDREIPMGMNGEGVQQVDVKQLPDGLWKVRLYWTVDAKDYYFTTNVFFAAAKN